MACTPEVSPLKLEVGVCYMLHRQQDLGEKLVALYYWMDWVGYAYGDGVADLARVPVRALGWAIPDNFTHKWQHWSRAWCLNFSEIYSKFFRFIPFLPVCKTTVSWILNIFLCYFKINLNMIAMPNSHLVLHEETLKQHFEK